MCRRIVTIFEFFCRSAGTVKVVHGDSIAKKRRGEIVVAVFDLPISWIGDHGLHEVGFDVGAPETAAPPPNPWGRRVQFQPPGPPLVL